MEPCVLIQRSAIYGSMATASRVMIVDDSPRTRSALAAYVSTLDGMYVVAEASNGLEAVQMLETRSPDIVIMDVCMPLMDGLDATRLLKARWPGIKVVILSIYANSEFEARSAGADAFLTKGCPAEEMAATIRSLVTA